MTEIKKTLAILKARWPEVALIIGIPLLAMLLEKLLLKAGAKSTLTIYSATLFLPLLFSLISILLRLGFLRTLYLEGTKRQSPFILLRIGAHFFWRMFVLGMIYTLLLIPLFLILHNLPNRSINHSDIPTLSHNIFWLNTLYSMLVSLM